MKCRNDGRARIDSPYIFKSDTKNEQLNIFASELQQQKLILEEEKKKTIILERHLCVCVCVLR